MTSEGTPGVYTLRFYAKQPPTGTPAPEITAEIIAYADNATPGYEVPPTRQLTNSYQAFEYVFRVEAPVTRVEGYVKTNTDAGQCADIDDVTFTREPL